MRGGHPVRDDARVSALTRPRVLGLLGATVYLANLPLLVLAERYPGHDAGLVAALVGLPPAIALGLLVAWRRPDSPVGPGLVWLAVAPAVTWSLENWGATYRTGHDWPAASLGTLLADGIWVFNLAGFVVLCLVFPDGPLPGRLWRRVPWLFLAAAVVIDALFAVQHAVLPGEWSFGQDAPAAIVLWLVADAVAALAFLATLGLAVASLVVRYRRGNELTRLQLRWLRLGAGSVPVLLAAGWIGGVGGPSPEWRLHRLPGRDAAVHAGHGRDRDPAARPAGRRPPGQRHGVLVAHHPGRGGGLRRGRCSG